MNPLRVEVGEKRGWMIEVRRRASRGCVPTSQEEALILLDDDDYGFFSWVPLENLRARIIDPGTIGTIDHNEGEI